jgi:hypothetical protein
VGKRNILLFALLTMVMRAEMLSALAIWRYFSWGGRGGEQIENKKYYVQRVFVKKDLNVGQLFVATVVKAFYSGCPSGCHKRHSHRSVTVQSTRSAVFFLLLPTWVCTRQ